MRPRPCLAAIAICGALGLATAHAQFRTQTTLVLVDVVVRDESGQTVDDLHQADFEILEDGVPRPIVSFDRGNAGVAQERGTATRPAGWNATSRGEPQSITAVVFHHLDPQSRVTAVRAMKRAIPSLGRSEFIGIYVLEESLVELAPFTNDVTVLKGAIDVAATTPSTTTAIGSGLTENPASLDSTGRGGADATAMRGRMATGLASMESQVAAGVQTAGLNALIAQLSQYPGRRAVFLFSGGLAMPDVIPKLEGTVASARRQHVSFYCLDARGLGSGGRRVTGKRRLDREELTSRSAEELFRRVRISEMDTTGGLGPLAELTGGIILSDTNDVAAITEAAFADRRSWYLLGYTSRDGVDIDKARVTVRVTRPGLSVRARTRIGHRPRTLLRAVLGALVGAVVGAVLGAVLRSKWQELRTVCGAWAIRRRT